MATVTASIPQSSLQVAQIIADLQTLQNAVCCPSHSLSYNTIPTLHLFLPSPRPPLHTHLQSTTATTITNHCLQYASLTTNLSRTPPQQATSSPLINLSPRHPSGANLQPRTLPSHPSSITWAGALSFRLQVPQAPATPSRG
jgi:hypothetical protein